MPNWTQLVRENLAPLRLPPERELEIVEELAQHLEAVYDAARRSGASVEEALQRTVGQISDGRLLESELSRAEQAFTTRWQQQINWQPEYKTKRGMRMETLWQDLRFGVRTLFKNPGFTLIAVLTLALGIGANTAIFSVVNAVLLQPLPFSEPERLLWLGGWMFNDKDQGVTPADFLDYREQSQSFAQLAASVSDGVPMNLTGTGEPERLKGGLVTANYLDVFGVQPMLGRTFTEEEGEEGGERVVALSHSLWQRRFGADPAIINQQITLDKRKVTVVGVMPPGFQYPLGVEIWQPFSFPASPQSAFRSRKLPFLRPVARLKPGVTRAQAQAEIQAIAERLQAQYPDTNKNKSLFLMPLQERLVGNIKLTLFVLLGAVGCVLLIACANVANLLLARATARQKEIAVRAALGASRGRIVRQLLTESLMLALLGSMGGVLLANWGVQLLVTMSADYIPRTDEIRLNASVFIFTLAIALLTGLLFGLVPALQSARLELTESLKEGKGAGSSVQRHRTLNLLVVGEVALAIVLLISAGLLVNSFVRLQQVRPGFDETNLLTMKIDLSNPYGDPEKKVQFFDQLQQRVAALPGVEAVGLVTELPLARQSADMDFIVERREEQTPRRKGHGDVRNINHGYFQAMRIPLLKGRNVTEAEVREGAKVVVISNALVRNFFADVEPLGQRLRLDVLGQEPYEIIGIVGDVRHRGLEGDPRQTMYFPSLRLGYTNLVIRTAIDPVSLAAAVRKEVIAIDPNQPVADVKTMEQWVSESIAQPRIRTLLLGVFSAVALLLSVVGIYGVMSYAVTQRTHELGIRLALGATTRDVLRLVVRQGMKLAVVGISIGLVGALGLTRLLKGLLFGVSTTDPLTFAVIVLLLLMVALLACWIPARRATKVDPLIALRSE